MDRAYSILTVKAVDDDERVIEGIASTPAPDRRGDVVEPMGARFRLPMPLLLDHDHRQSVGFVEFARPDKAGIPFKARIARIDEPGEAKDLVDKAWQLAKAGLRAAVSIGFAPLKHEVLKEGGVRFTEWDWLELSLVTIPANTDATITVIRSVDTRLRAAMGRERPGIDRDAMPGVSGPDPQPNPRKGVPNMAAKTIAEQISAFEATRAAKAARMTELMDRAAEKGETLDAAGTEEYDGLSTEVKAVDAHLARLADLETANAAKARPVDGGSSSAASESRGGVSVQVKGGGLPKGTAFTRYAIALARSKGNLMQAAEIAKGWHDSTPEVETVIKAAVAAGTTTDPGWAAPLVEYQAMASEFIELLRPATIIGRIQGLRRVPFNIKIPGQASGSAVNWVGEGRPKPVSALAFDTTTLAHTKCAGIVVLTDELIRFSNPSAEALVRQDLIDAIAQFLDRDFVDPGKAEREGVSPASITHGVAPVIASGTAAEALRRDVKALFSAFVAANLSPSGGVWIMTPTQALAIGMMQNGLGQPEFPGIGMNGGTFFGLPLILSENIPASPVPAEKHGPAKQGHPDKQGHAEKPRPGSAKAGEEDAAKADEGGSPAVPVPGSRIILAKPGEILLADDGGVTLDVSREASLQMDSAPADGAQSLVSLWQNNMVGIRAERFINWKRRRPQAVAYIDGANYGG